VNGNSSISRPLAAGLPCLVLDVQVSQLVQAGTSGIRSFHILEGPAWNLAARYTVFSEC